VKGRAELSRRRLAFTTRDLFKQPLSAAEIRALARQTDGGVRALLSTRTAQHKALGLDRREVSDAELVDLMAKEPRLLRRPLLTADGSVVVGYDREAYGRLG
jgi:Spx/MgsR family transcriptional regulator